MSFDSDVTLLASDVQVLHNVIHGSESTVVATEGGTIRTVAGTLKAMATYNPRGVWAASTPYSVKDAVYTDGYTYVCFIGHTSSSTFAADASKWGLLQLNPWQFVSWYTSLTAAVAEIGTTTKTRLIVDSPTTCTANTVVPSNIELVVTVEGSIAQGAYTLTINSSFEAGCYRVFTGSGTIVGLKWVYPQWFGVKGDGVTDDTVAWQAAINSAAGGKLIVPKAIYSLGAWTIPPASNTIIEGHQAILSFNASNAAFITISDTVDDNVSINISGLILQGNNKANSKGVYISHIHGVVLKHIQTYDFTQNHLHLKNAWIFNAYDVYMQAASAKCTSIVFLENTGLSTNFYHTRLLSNNTGDGVLIKDTQGVNFYGSDFEGNLYGVRLIASSGARTDTNKFDGCDFESNTKHVGIGESGTTDAVLGTVLKSCNFVAGSAHGASIVLDKAISTRLEDISIGNTDISTTSNTRNTYYSTAYGGTPTQGCALNISNYDQWQDQNDVSGVWTPSVAGADAAGSATYSVQVGRFHRKGRICHIQAHITWTALSGAAGNLRVTGLPYNFRNVVNSQGLFTVMALSGLTWTGYALMAIAGGPNYGNIDFYGVSSGSATPVTVTTATSGNLIITGTYEIEGP